MSSFLEQRGAIFDSNFPVVPQNVEARCVACLFKLPNDIARIIGDTRFEDDFKPNGISYHVVAADSLQKSIDRGCTVCALIVKDIPCSFIERHHQNSYLTWYDDRLGWTGDHGDHSVASRSREFFLVCEDGSSNVQQRVQARFVDATSHPFASILPSFGANTGSTQTTARIHEWISHCSTHHSHSQCDDISTRKMPPQIRMLEILDYKSTRVRLVDGTSNKEFAGLGSSVKFAALSHRWGPKTKDASLTRANIKKFREEVPRSSLYQLFQDAISVAGEAGLKYIWIDCLCILQDDVHDFNHQAGNMAFIYAGAYVVISGTGCIDSDQGLFVDSPIKANTKFITNTSPYSIYFGPSLYHPPSFKSYLGTPDRLDLDPKVYPLANRAWAYQERILAKRIVHFAQQEVFWECEETSQCECGYYENPEHKDDFLDLPWHDMIETYSRMGLTKRADRLPAIAGVAKACAERHSFTYRAGLWEETIAHDLFWRPFRSARSSLKSLGPRVRPLVAPTWSWASSRGGVYFQDCPLGLETLIEVKDYKFKPLYGGDDYSQPAKACLHVEGPVALGTIIKCRSDWGSEIRMKLGDKILELMPDYDISADGEDHIEFGTSLPFLLLFDHDGGAFGVVLRCRNKEDNEYERIGTIGFWGRDDKYPQLYCFQVLELAERKALTLI